MLLCALISHSIIYYPSEKFWNAIKLSIDNSSTSDTESICKAINIAKPSGLSKNINQKYDTDKSPSIGLKELMCYASAYDRISYEYCNYFRGIRTQILPMLDKRLKASNYIDISDSHRAYRLYILSVLSSSYFVKLNWKYYTRYVYR